MNEREKSQKNQDLATACARSRDLILLGLTLLLHEISNVGENWDWLRGEMKQKHNLKISKARRNVRYLFQTQFKSEMAFPARS